MEKINFINIYLQRLDKINDLIRMMEVTKNYKGYSDLINEKRCIEDYLRDKGITLNIM